MTSNDHDSSMDKLSNIAKNLKQIRRKKTQISNQGLKKRSSKDVRLIK